MKKKTILTLFVFISFFAVTGCSNNHKVDKNINKDVINAESEFDNNMEIVTNINATIKEKIYKVILEDNETAQAFAKLLPQDFKMSELNGNEKYVYMNNTLPVNSVNPEQINAGI
ncbi:MAG: hypothetical protein K2J20_03935 [Bacilli bacterium]|nr:hypothetical protein [Bacilli bacterium]